MNAQVSLGRNVSGNQRYMNEVYGSRVLTAWETSAHAAVLEGSHHCGASKPTMAEFIATASIVRL